MQLMMHKDMEQAKFLTKKDIYLSFISMILMFCLFAGGLAVISADNAYQLPGDGFEYLMMPVSIMNHASTDVTDQDIEEAKAYYGNNIFDTIYRDRQDITLVKGSDGRSYAKHFGLYSVVGMPLRAVFHMAGTNPAKAYMYMNLLFWIAACLLIQFALNASQLQKTLLMVFAVINPAWFYLTWVHTEVFMFALVIAGLVFLNNKRYLLSMLMLSIAAMNNLTLLVPAFFVGIEFIITAYKDSGKKAGVTFKKTIPILIASVPGFIPIIRSFILFGSYSPVASVASVANSGDPVDNRFICALSYIFDPNQGMIAYTLLIAPVFFIIAVINLIRKRNVMRTVLDLLIILGMLFIVAQELHINCGMAYIMRYNVWMLPFMAFFNVFNLNAKSSVAVFSLSGAWSMFIIVLVGIISAPNLYLDHTVLGKMVLSKIPSLYNPPVGIFYSRTLTEETYYCDYPVPYYDSNGNLRKVLLTSEAYELLRSGEWTIYGPDNDPIEPDSLNGTNINGEAFTYLSFNEDGYHMVRDTDRLDFARLVQNDRSFIRSSVGYEGNSALVYGKELHLCLHMLPGDYTGVFRVSNVFGGIQDVTVTVNGAEVFSGPVTMESDIVFDYTIGDDYLCDLKIYIPGALSPMSVIPDSADDRVLSLYLRDFTYTAR